ncbi:hypothetical protein DS745_21510 [Anaerobacillus alkaliphilus]|uniref:Uncharacterized protein n=1 Tax=Anaerobacillus alkaliphilus TaxID=1548597 RepID=A0A4Q0VLR7_9BACI|nr:hypothetical protein [Anaerobacillus alkaliphilus]RXI96308.1 hypothetical protein DS745_21510 [Anaerobacillus alkaliphilus]
MNKTAPVVTEFVNLVKLKQKQKLNQSYIATKDNTKFVGLDRLEEQIHDQVKEGVHAPIIQEFQCLREVALVTMTSIVAEFGSF